MHPDQPKIDLRKQARSQAWADDHGMTVVAGVIGPAAEPVAPVALFVHDPENPTHRDFALFADWRKSKCRPRDYSKPEDRLADLDQATLELVGEVGEVVELIVSLDGRAENMDAAFRDKLIDEIGDVYFCASWLGDAWEVNPLRAGLSVEGLGFGEAHRTIDVLERTALELAGRAGMLANSAKKVLFQGRDQSLDAARHRLFMVFQFSTLCLSVVGATWDQATARNVEKLDARWPVGMALAGGGIRTGKGA